MSEGETPRKSGGGGDASDPLDAVLAAWPKPAGDHRDSSDVVSRVLSHIASGQTTLLAQASPPLSDDDLLRSPLPALPGEPQLAAAVDTPRAGTGMTAESRERDRASFRDLAKLANAAPPSSAPGSSPRSAREPASGQEETGREEHSGVIHLAALGEASASASPPVAQGTTSPSPAPAAALAAVAPSIPSTRPSRRPPSEAPPGSGPSSRRTNPGKKSRRSWVGISSLVAVAAVAAGVLLSSRRAPQVDPSATVAAVAPSPPAAASLAPTAAPVQPVLGVAPAAPEVAPDDRGVDPASLPPASTAVALARATPSAPPSAMAKPAVTPPARATAPAMVAAAPAPGADPAASANLQTLMQQAAGVTSAPAAPATTSPDAPPAALGSVPLRPSQGALQGALGAALPSARACLGPDDAISHATITFGSDGSAVSVGVSGGAAGKPAEACIRAALMKTRVAPFAQPTFTATTTVRPN